MRIISYGHIKPKIMFCGGCGATYEYLPRDVQEFRPGIKFSKNFVKCPVCGHATWVNDMLIKHADYVIFADEEKQNND